MKDHGLEFEEVVNHYVKRPTYVTYANYWHNKNERIALLYTACLLAYDKNTLDLSLEHFLKENYLYLEEINSDQFCT